MKPTGEAISDEPMRTFTLHLPEGDGSPTRRCHVDIPLNEGRIGYIEFPWPMTERQHEAFVFQLEHHLEVMRRYFVRATSQAETVEIPKQETGIISAQTPCAETQEAR